MCIRDSSGDIRITLSIYFSCPYHGAVSAISYISNFSRILSFINVRVNSLSCVLYSSSYLSCSSHNGIYPLRSVRLIQKSLSSSYDVSQVRYLKCVVCSNVQLSSIILSQYIWPNKCGSTGF